MSEAYGAATGFNLQQTLKNATARDVEDTDRMKVYVMRYFDIVKVNLADLTPKIIINFLVKQSIKRARIQLNSQCIPKNAEEV